MGCGCNNGLSGCNGSSWIIILIIILLLSGGCGNCNSCGGNDCGC